MPKKRYTPEEIIQHLRTVELEMDNDNGKFYFKLVDGERVLLQSTGFASPKDAGARIGILKRGGFDQRDPTVVLGDDVEVADAQAALAAFAAEPDKTGA